MKNRIILIVALVLIIGGFVLWRSGVFTPAPSYDLTLVEGDSVTSWDFTSAYTDNAELKAKAQTEIKRLTKLIGSGEYSDYVLYVSIANQYDLMGDGANELSYLKHALALDATSTGLAWNNVGQLFAHVGAYASAREALERAVEVQPVEQYHAALLDFLKQHYPSDTEAITAEEQALQSAQQGSHAF